MSHRRLHILVALLCTGLWAGAIWLGHSSGHLRFLDRLESALTDVRTLARGVKASPDLVTIVAIDDTIVKLSGTYPLPRAEIAKIVEAIARLEPKVIAIGQKLTIEPDRLLFGDRPIATASDYALPISYYGPRRTIRTVSAANLIDGQIDREAIRGRIVVLGATATGAGDFFPTPFDSLMPGVEIISTAITHLVAGDGVVRDRPVRIAEAIVTILLPMLLIGLLSWRRNAIGLLTVGSVMLV